MMILCSFQARGIVDAGALQAAPKTNKPIMKVAASDGHLRPGVQNEDIQFNGRVVKGQAFYVGIYKLEWDRLTQGLLERSVACTYLPRSSPGYGAHTIDDSDEEGRCYCLTFLYPQKHPAGEEHNCPAHVQRDDLEFIMQESDVHTTKSIPAAGKKIECLLKRTVVSIEGAETNIEQWWVCTVLCTVKVTGGKCIGKTGHLKTPAYSILQQGKMNVQLDGERTQAGDCVEIDCRYLERDSRVKYDDNLEHHGKVKVKFDGYHSTPTWISLDQFNQTGSRLTKQQPGQAPFGCKWFGAFRDVTKEAEDLGQIAEIVYKKGHRGLRTLDGLGNSQLKEVLYLKQAYDYGATKQFKEVDAAEFAAENFIEE